MILFENGSPRYRRIIATLLSLYPWLLMVLVSLNVRNKLAGGFSAQARHLLVRWPPCHSLILLFP